MAAAMRLLVVRNDKLGDFMLAWPTFALLKHHWPEAHITALVPEYTAPMARLCPWLDEVLLDDASGGVLGLARQLRQQRFAAMLTLFSTGRVALAGALARIPYRLAPATKAAQLLYNRRLMQRRSRSEKPEYAYNLDLAYRLLADFGRLEGPSQTREENGDWLPTAIQRPLLRFADDVALLKESFCREHGLPEQSQLVFIHPGSGGSANNLRPEQYTQLANRLGGSTPLAFVISAGPGEESIAKEVAAGIAAPAAVYDSGAGLESFARTLQLADLFISGSTGPLHVAAALDRPTAAFYPRHRSATPLRWQTTNAPEKRLAFTPPEQSEEREVQQIDIAAAAARISSQLLR
jgi:ADP-heptose:LPS heptosyltransferase